MSNIMKVVKREIEEEVIDKQICDNCNLEIKYPNTCGFGAKYDLTNGRCFQCDGEHFNFCSLKCLKEFVSKLKSQTETGGKK